MAGISEFSLDLCFIRDSTAADPPDFKDAVEQEIGRLFAPYASWTVTFKHEGPLEIAVAEMKGVGPWETEEDALHYIDSRAGERYWQWLQGYHLQLERKEDAGCCKLGH